MQNQSQQLIDLKHIENNAYASLLGQFLNSTDAQALPKAILVPDGFSLKNTAQYKAGRDRFTGSFETPSKDEWAAYIKAQELGKDSASCFIDGDRLTAKAILDLGSIDQPGHCSHHAELDLEFTPEYDFLINTLNEIKMNQKQMAERLEEWSDFIDAVDDTEDEQKMSAKELVQAIRKINIEATSSIESEVGQYAENRSSLEKIEAKNKERMPSIITFKCRPTEDLDERDFALRLSVIADSGKPVLVMRVQRLAVIKKEIAEEFKGLAKEALTGSPVQTYVGTGKF
jgi:uncharacterized protein YfdQ (DUF2303 family)